MLRTLRLWPFDRLEIRADFGGTWVLKDLGYWEEWAYQPWPDSNHYWLWEYGNVKNN